MSKQYKLIRCNINGKDVEKMVDVRASLTDMLRNDYHLTSVKKGCEVGECGACTVLIDGETFNSCIYLAVWADGKHIRTLEGLLSPDGERHPAGLYGGVRHPVRFLHPRLSDDCRGDPGQRQALLRCGAPQAALRSPVPLHRI